MVGTSNQSVPEMAIDLILIGKSSNSKGHRTAEIESARQC